MNVLNEGLHFLSCIAFAHHFAVLHCPRYAVARECLTQHCYQWAIARKKDAVGFAISVKVPVCDIQTDKCLAGAWNTSYETDRLAPRIP
jgi:hypothetical protein